MIAILRTGDFTWVSYWFRKRLLDFILISWGILKFSTKTFSYHFERDYLLKAVFLKLQIFEICLSRNCKKHLCYSFIFELHDSIHPLIWISLECFFFNIIRGNYFMVYLNFLPLTPTVTLLRICIETFCEKVLPEISL